METGRMSVSVPLSQVQIRDEFWGPRIDKVRTKILPYQWEALNDRIPGAALSHCMENYKIAAGLAEGEFSGCVFQDSDFAKWIEAVAYSLQVHPDPELEAVADEAIAVVVQAQQPDGYLNTYYTINSGAERWSNMRDHHELYCAGHLIEGAVAYYEATGKTVLLEAMERYVEYIRSVFGPEEGKRQGYPGHEVIEMALVRLYGATGKEQHLSLARYFIDQRGQSPLYFAQEEASRGQSVWWQYYQAGLPVREQRDAEGHAVRAAYLYSGMADIARLTGDESLAQACRRLWASIVTKRMYITGGIGSSAPSECFTFDYDLPNDTAYAETCAAIGLVFFARRMLELEPKGQYADVCEQALYNGVISGMSLDGTEFFYVNPLEALPEASEKSIPHQHVKIQRQKWFGCACCPPNLARLLGSVGQYVYGAGDDILYVHLYIGGSTECELNGVSVRVEVATRYPWDGQVYLTIIPETAVQGTIALRIPGWCRSYQLTAGDEPILLGPEDGYVKIQRTWKQGDRLSLRMDMPVRVVSANPRVRQDVGRVAVMRGPLVYCLEEADNGAGLRRLYMGASPDFTCREAPDLLDGVVALRSRGRRLTDAGWEEGPLYQDAVQPCFEDAELTWIPYYAWANRTPGEMVVWINR